jgi:hypothetical protein
MFAMAEIIAEVLLTCSKNTWRSADNPRCGQVRGRLHVSEVLAAFVTRLAADWKDAAAGHSVLKVSGEA